MENEELVTLIQEGKIEYMEDLYFQNKGLVYNSTRRYSFLIGQYNKHNAIPIVERDDLMHEAYFGLYKAALSFNFEKDTKFSTYADLVMRTELKRFCDNCGRMIRIPVHMQEKFYRYNSLRCYYLSKYDCEPSIDDFKEYLCVNDKQLDDIEKSLKIARVESLDKNIMESGDEIGTLADLIPSDCNLEEEVVKSAIANESVLKQVIHEVLRSEELVSVIIDRYFEKQTRNDVSKKLGITKDAVRNLELKALGRLKCNSKTKKIARDFDLTV